MTDVRPSGVPDTLRPAGDGAVIDLGVDFALTPTPTPPGRRGRDRGGRTRDRGRHRMVALLVSVVMALLGLGAAAGPATALVPVGDFAVPPGSVVMVTGDRLLVGVSAGVSRLSAYRISTGKRLWTTDLTIAIQGAAIGRIGGTLVVGRNLDSAGGDNLNAIDLATGRRLWTSGASVMHLDAEHLAGVTFDPEDLIDQAAIARADVAGLDPRTGRMLWHRPFSFDCRFSVDTVWAEVCPTTSQLNLYDVTSGTLLFHRALHVVLEPDGNPQLLDLQQMSGVVVVTYPAPDGPVVEGIDAKTGAPLWHRSIAADDGVGQCAALLCFTHGDPVQAVGDPGPDSYAIDPRSGAERPVPEDIVMTSISEASGLGIAQAPVLPGSRYAMIPNGLRPDSTGAYPGASALIDIGSDRAVTVPVAASLDSFLAAVDPVSLHMAILARLPEVGILSCFAVGEAADPLGERPRGDYLACEMPLSRLRIWRVRPSSAPLR